MLAARAQKSLEPASELSSRKARGRRPQAQHALQGVASGDGESASTGARHAPLAVALAASPSTSPVAGEGLGLAVREGVEGEPPAEEHARDGGNAAHVHRLGLKRAGPAPIRGRDPREAQRSIAPAAQSNALRKAPRRAAGERKGVHQEVLALSEYRPADLGQELGGQRGRHALHPDPGGAAGRQRCQRHPEGRLAAATRIATSRGRPDDSHAQAPSMARGRPRQPACTPWGMPRRYRC